MMGLQLSSPFPRSLPP